MKSRSGIFSLLLVPAQVLAAPIAPAPSTSPAPAPSPSAAPEPPPLPPRPWSWKRLDLPGLPPSIQVSEGDAVNADGQPVRAWAAAIDYTDRALQARAVLSQTPIGREPTSVLARKSNALVAVNGGYFSMAKAPLPAPTFSLVLSNGRVLASNVPAVSRATGKYFVTRGAFGVRPDRTLDVAWIAHLPAASTSSAPASTSGTSAASTPSAQGEVWSYPSPLPDRQKAPTREFPVGGSAWAMAEAIGGAPVLLERGEARIEADAEAIGPEMTLKRHPRTLVGWAGGSRMILVVADGRQKEWSMGLTLPEAAALMRDLGCVEALNLDGGGSSAFYAAGRVLNRPSDGRERNVTSIWAIAPAPLQ